MTNDNQTIGEVYVNNNLQSGPQARPKRIRHKMGRGTFDICQPTELNLKTTNTQQNSQQLIQKRIQCVGNYDLGRTIGSGQFGKVKLAEHVLTREKVFFFSFK